KWHDGKPFTSEDVLFTFKAVACPLTDTAPLRSFLTDLQDIVMDGRTMRFNMSKPNAYNISNLANSLAIVPKHVYDAEGLLDAFSYKDMIGPRAKTDPRIKKFADQFNSHPANRAPIGTGPYKFEKWESGRELVLTRNDDYWGKKPYLDKVVYRVITDYTAAPFFKDKRVRQAMTMLIDRQKIIENIRLGLGKIGVSPIDLNSKNFNPDLKPLPYDPKRAGELLDEAGWKDHDGDGIRDKDGMKFKFEFLGSTGSTIYKQLSPVMAEAFRKEGIEM